jgi:predicted negative regulator of RcsB-dependent stress response
MKDFRNVVLSSRKNILGILVLCAAVTGGIYFYRHNRTAQEEQAHVALTETLQQLDRAFTAQTTWSDVALAAQTGYQRFSGTSLAPYFLLVKAEAEVHNGLMDQALKNMDSVVQHVSKHSMLHDVFVLKQARLLIESADEALVAQGLKKLEQLANGTGNVADAGLYYVGRYYADRNDTARAHEAWKTLLEKYASQQPAEMSPWAELVQGNMQQSHGAV